MAPEHIFHASGHEHHVSEPVTTVCDIISELHKRTHLMEKRQFIAMQNNKVVHCMPANRTNWIRWDKSEPYMRFDRADKYVTVTVITQAGMIRTL